MSSFDTSFGIMMKRLCSWMLYIYPSPAHVSKPCIDCILTKDQNAVNSLRLFAFTLLSLFPHGLVVVAV
jgi:hypothetical protein